MNMEQHNLMQQRRETRRHACRNRKSVKQQRNLGQYKEMGKHYLNKKEINVIQHARRKKWYGE